MVRCFLERFLSSRWCYVEYFPFMIALKIMKNNLVSPISSPSNLIFILGTYKIRFGFEDTEVLSGEKEDNVLTQA